MMTIKEFKETAPKWLVELAYKRSIEEDGGEYWEDENYFISAFTWVYTPEGEDFWINVDNGIYPTEPPKTEKSESFDYAVKLLRDLADLQNGAPLEQHKEEWEETMKRVYDFLEKYNG